MEKTVEAANSKDTYRSVSEIVVRAEHKASVDARKFTALVLARKLDALEKSWEEVVGTALARKSSMKLLEYDDKTLRLTINVENGAVLSAAGFRCAGIERKLARILGWDKVKIKFKIGSVIRHQSGGTFVPAYRRRKCVVLDENDVMVQQNEFEKSGVSSELAAKLARVKLTIEALSKRK